MLRLEIEGRWEPENFIRTLEGIESLYYKVAISRSGAYETSFFWYERPGIFSSYDDHLNWTNDWLLARARLTARSFERLTVAGIHYGSPGEIDLLGIGKGCKAVADIVGKLVIFCGDRELRKQLGKQAKIDTAIKEVELKKEEESLRTLKLKNAREIFKLHRDYASMPEDLFLGIVINDQDKIFSQIAEGKLVGIGTVDGDLDRPE